MQTEFELKFQVPETARDAVKDRMDSPEAARSVLEAHYFDTADGILSGHGASLRLRREDSRWVQTLKARGEHALQRVEHHAELDFTQSGLPVPDLSRHANSEAGLSLTSALGTRKHPLELFEVYGTQVRRVSLLMERPTGKVEVAFDEGELIAGDRRRPVCELELELKDGEAGELFALAHEWVAGHGLWLDIVPKGTRAQWLAQDLSSGPPIKAAPPKLDRRMTPELVLQRVVDACLDQMLQNASEVASGLGNSQHVHQLRVGIRRLRTTMREINKLSPDLDPQWEAPLVEAFRALGMRRDLEVLAAGVEPQLVAVGAPQPHLPPLDPPAPEPAEVVRSTAFQQVLLCLVEFTNRPARAGEVSRDTPAAALIRKRLKALHRKLTRDADDFDRLELPAQHRVRKRLKRLRYLAEFAAPLYGRRRVERFLKTLEPAQDALGHHNDQAVAMEVYGQAADSDPRAWFAVGWLRSQLSLSALDGRRALRKIGKVRPFWKGVQ